MRHRSLVALAAVVAAAVVPSTASAALKDVRADFTNGTDRSLEVQVWHNGWQDERTVAPDDTLRDLTDDKSHLTLWIVGCGQLTLNNPLIGAPAVSVYRNGHIDTSWGVSEDDSMTFNRYGMRFLIHRSSDTDRFKELSATLRDCNYDASVERPRQPVGDAA